MIRNEQQVVLKQLQLLLQDPSLNITEQVQSLWSGYGQIVRVNSANTGQRYIVKAINPRQAGKHPRGWHSEHSHQRKLHSYQVEAHFYQHYAPRTNAHCQVPQLIASQLSAQNSLLVMQDLDAIGFSVRKQQADWFSLKRAIKWLAWFHARFMGEAISKNLWPVGSYWHLATRQAEWQAMADSEYKTHAQTIDAALNRAQFQTLLHGDAKFANLCFHASNNGVAAVDFQYAGRGSGVKDLAYLAGSCLGNSDLVTHNKHILDEYLNQLTAALTHYRQPVELAPLTAEMRYLYPVAWADFYRFLLGWNPQSPKICNFMQRMAQKGLERSIAIKMS